MSELLIEDTLGKRMKVLLKREKLKYSDLSGVTGLAESTISDIINDRVIPRSDTLKILSDFFHVSTDYLLCKTDDPDEINHDREVIGLSVEAARKLREGEVNSAVINGIIESENADVFSNAVSEVFSNLQNGVYEATDEVWKTFSDVIGNSAESVFECENEIKRNAKVIGARQGEFSDYDKANAVRAFEDVLENTTPKSNVAPNTTFKDIMNGMLNGKNKIEPAKLRKEMGIGESEKITAEVMANFVYEKLRDQEESKTYPNMLMKKFLGNKEKAVKIFALFYKMFE